MTYAVREFTGHERLGDVFSAKTGAQQKAGVMRDLPLDARVINEFSRGQELSPELSDGQGECGKPVRMQERGRRWIHAKPGS